MANSGLASSFGWLLRRFSRGAHALSLVPLYLICIVCMGVSLTPSLALLGAIDTVTQAWATLPRSLALGLALAAGYFAYGLTLIFVVPFANLLLRTRLRPRSGPYYSLASVRWYVHNGLTYIVRFTFLDCITPTPLNILFFRMMGMQIGKDVQINSSHISDPSLISLGDGVTIGGSATIVAHYGVGGLLVLSPVKIAAGATVGLRAVVMGGVDIGEKARILPNSVLLPRAKVPPGETWGGVPAQRVDTRSVASRETAPAVAHG